MLLGGRIVVSRGGGWGGGGDTETGGAEGAPGRQSCSVSWPGCQLHGSILREFIQQYSFNLCTCLSICYLLIKSLFKKQAKNAHVYSKESTGWGKWRPLQGPGTRLWLLCPCGSEMGLCSHFPALSRSTVMPPPTGRRCTLHPGFESQLCLAPATWCVWASSALSAPPLRRV